MPLLDESPASLYETHCNIKLALTVVHFINGI